MSSPTPPPSGARPDVLGSLLTNPAAQNLILQGLVALVGAIAGLFKKGPPAPPPVHVPSPAPAPGGTVGGFPDDTIPEPTPTRTVKSVRLRLARAQYSRERFPEQYTDANPDGLYSDADLRKAQAGEQAINFGSKVWLDLTAFDEDGREFLRPAVLAHGLAYQTSHACGDASIMGRGADAAGQPLPYDQAQGEHVTGGISAWVSSLGFLMQFKVHREGSFPCGGRVANVGAEGFTLKVS